MDTHNRSMLSFLCYLMPATGIALVHHDCLTWEGEPRPVTSVVLGIAWPVVMLCVMAYLVVETCDTVRGWMR